MFACARKRAVLMAFALCSAPLWGQTERASKPAPEPRVTEEDPFAGLSQTDKHQATPQRPANSWKAALFTENFGFRKEIMSQFDTSERGRPASRQSAGFEVLKKFSTATATIAAFDFQGRLVRRVGFNPVINDMEGE